MKKRIVSLAGVLIFLAGALLILYPAGKEAVADLQNNKIIEEFEEERTEAAEEVQDPESSCAQLRNAMEDYNLQIYEEHQEGLCDAWSYQQNVFDFSAAGIADDMIGYISIEAMEIELPLYVGANTENMSKGAVVLSQTSMPLGGPNTNCVIAAHRGWKGTAMFRNIEALKPGDEVVITNLWETLHYEVAKTIVIDPADIDAVKILEGEDMVTLITCHPYTKNYQRYVVYCSRKDGDPVREIEVPFEGESYTSSEPEIEKEQKISLAAMLLVGIGLTALAAVWVVSKRSG